VVPAQGFAVDDAPFDKAICLKCEEAKFACQHVVFCICARARGCAARIDCEAGDG